ncbi:hypothetical protein NDU88_005132 [Pleurodeles waltl]|uniref:Uncharacterized protein n=1 Tax=Pleurodeles waltl TaxID=8319 RepID=A0AAV7WYM8_PLEWA|nr:hypothetical protein NDU88_005132 [Pleurodeles waltl]
MALAWANLQATPLRGVSCSCCDRLLRLTWAEAAMKMHLWWRLEPGCPKHVRRTAQSGAWLRVALVVSPTLHERKEVRPGGWRQRTDSEPDRVHAGFDLGALT